MSEPDTQPPDRAGGGPSSGAATGLVAAVIGVLITSLPQLAEQLSPGNRALLALVALSLGLSVFATVRARREAPRRRLWVTTAVAGGVVSGGTALVLGAGALLGAVTAPPVAIGFNDEFLLRSHADEDVRIGALPLAAGSYVIWAKLYAENPEDSGVRVTCRLDAGNDYDILAADVPPAGSAPITLTVAHTYRDADSVVLRCRNASRSARSTSLKQVKILALGADSVRIDYLGG
ncbi:hypothetical protein MUU72_06925 [Streptomyces sp. RS10V-4]|uniref:hypothetical protein n=1 Tax=Streptomyces rhizoryzae TaxID=2932493 RepID=UPI00200457F2|nr:hypothetical protein [Streptomyces rhizoryzae]MCK7622838.1 hypothetical protein [Streptomyces rhizoryzae]